MSSHLTAAAVGPIPEHTPAMAITSVTTGTEDNTTISTMTMTATTIIPEDDLCLAPALARSPDPVHMLGVILDTTGTKELHTHQRPCLFIMAPGRTLACSLHLTQGRATQGVPLEG